MFHVLQRKVEENGTDEGEEDEDEEDESVEVRNMGNSGARLGYVGKVYSRLMVMTHQRVLAGLALMPFRVIWSIH